MSDENATELEKVKAVKRKWQDALLSIPGVVSVGISNKSILVRVKDWETAKKIPKEIDGVPVRIQVGKIYFFSYVQRMRPVPGGVSISPWLETLGWAGTLGCLVKDSLTGQILGLTNAHVLGTPIGDSPGLPRGHPVIQPGKYDGGTEDDIIGYIYSWVPISKEETNLVDCAAFQPSSPTILKNEILDIGRPQPVRPVEPQLDMTVQKTGRTTEWTVGKITAVDVSEQVYYDGVIQFAECFEIESDNPLMPKFSDHGDSGSLILDMENRPVGLLFAGGQMETGEHVTVACKASNVQRLLGVTFLAPSTSFLQGFIPTFALAFISVLPQTVRWAKKK